jgi:hypothetical protein
MTTVPQTMLATSTRCDVVVTNFNGKSPAFGGGMFTYVPQGGNRAGGSNTGNVPTLTTRAIYIAVASVAAIALIVGSQFVHRRGSEERKDRVLQSQEEVSAFASRETKDETNGTAS